MLNYPYSIVIDGSAWGKDGASIYEREIRFILDGLVSYQSALAILIEIELSPWYVTIVPSEKRQDAGTGRNPTVDSAQWAAGTTPSGEEYLTAGREDSGQVYRDPRGQPIFGTGTGSLSRIRFSKAGWLWSDRYGRISPERVLVHELCHAMRQVSGMNLNRVMEGHFHNEEEFYAILLENIYVSEGRAKGQSVLPLRADHENGWLELAQELYDPKNFYSEHKDKIKQLCKQMGRFTFALSQVACEFNPIKEFFKDPNREGGEEVPSPRRVVGGAEAALA